MRIRIDVVLATILFGGSLYVPWGLPSHGTADRSRVPPSPANTARADDDPGYAYVGSFRCKKCHLSEYKSWEATRMAKSFDILKPGEHQAAKEKFKIDPHKDYTTDASCLKCHTTGFERAGGYATPAGNDEKAMKKAERLAGVGCETCHGPGSAYVDVFEEILKSKRNYKVEELYAVGLAKIDEATCKGCHNQDGPTYDPTAPFDYEKRKRDGVHAVQPLKQREE